MKPEQYEHARAVCENANRCSWRRISEPAKHARAAKLLGTTCCMQIRNGVHSRAPEAKLFLAVIELAVLDLCLKGADHPDRLSAQRYLFGPGGRNHCTMLGLDFAYLRRCLDQFGLA